MIYSLYFSPTQTTAAVTNRIAYQLTLLAPMVGNVEYRQIDVTTPAARQQVIEFKPYDIVIFGVPVYIGRVPNLIAPYLKTIKANGATGIAVVVYGNRAFDNALIELRDIMLECGFVVPAAAAFVGEHSFSKTLGAGRPDTDDLRTAGQFAIHLSPIVFSRLISSSRSPVEVPGEPFPYKFYNALTDDKKPIDLRRVKPVTNPDLCTRCGICADLCPMGAIDKTAPGSVTGICIKCNACVKRCPSGAKLFTDEVYLHHKHQLETNFTTPRRAPEIFIGKDKDA